MEMYVLLLLCIYITIAATGFHVMFQDKGIHLNGSKEIEKIILDQCFTNKHDQIVAFVNWSHYNSNYLFKSGTKSFTLMGIKENDALEKYTVKITRYMFNPNDTFIKLLPVNNVVIVNFDKKFFRHALLKLKNSLYWNIEALFFINNEEFPNSCIDAHLILQIIWDFNILSAVFLCQDSDFKVRLYTFNPYSQDAPKFWKRVGSYKQNNGHLLTIFTNFQEIIQMPVVTSLCEVIWFDKTKDLSGYPIKIAAPDLTVRYRDRTTGEIRKYIFFESSHKVFSIIWKILKTNYTTTYYNAVANSGRIDSNGIASGITAEVMEGKYDMRTGGDSQRGFFKNEFVSYRRDGHCFILSKKKSSISHQLLAVFNFQFWCLSIPIFIIATLLLKYTLQLINYLDIVIDIIRGLVGTSMMYEPDFLLGKLIFLWFVFAFMILSSFLQSVLPAMLTIATVFEQNIKSPWDLINNNYKVYSPPYVKQYYADTPIATNKLYITDVLDCLRLIKNDTTIACINFCLIAKIVITENDDVHIFKYDPSERYIVHLLRDDFPLRRLIEWLHIRLYESGIPERLYNFDVLIGQKKILHDSNILTVDQLEFIFYFLTMASAFCIIIFIIEFSGIYRTTRYNFNLNVRMKE